MLRIVNGHPIAVMILAAAGGSVLAVKIVHAALELCP